MKKKNTKLKKQQLRKSKKRLRKTKKRFRGGFTNPLYEFGGNMISTVGSAIQSTLDVFSIPPTPTHIPNSPSSNPSVQFTTLPVSKTILQTYNSIN